MNSKKDEGASQTSAPAAQAAARAAKTELSDEELLQRFLSLPPQQRAEQFVSTARAAELIDRSPRTIQRWIESGAIRAVFIVGRYRVELASLIDHVKRQANK
jgi:hypothetical protein